MTASQAKVLVVEDDLFLREAIAFDLRRRKYQVLSAASGNEAVKVVHSQHIDLILSDVRMGDGDGLELLRQMQKLGKQRPEVILITGFFDFNTDQALSLGAKAVFSKPFDRKAVAATVDRIVSNL